MQYLVFACLKVWGRSRVAVWEQNFFYGIVCIGSIKYVSTFCKRYFQLYQWPFSLLRPKNTQIFKFFLKSVWKRSKIIVCKKKKKKKKKSVIVCNKNFRQIYAYHNKNFQQHSLRSSLDLAQNIWIFGWVLATPSLLEIKGHSITAT